MAPSKALQRFLTLLAHDTDLLASLKPDTVVIGMDEVGRGCCMGPVVAAAVVFPKQTFHSVMVQLPTWHALTDSKAMTAPQREQVMLALKGHCQVGVGHVSAQEVDAINVHQASLLAASRAYMQLIESWPTLLAAPHHLLMDGRSTLPKAYLPTHSPCGITQQAIIKGDGLSWSIAAASVMAKQTRDAGIISLANEYPHYGWDTNMGYPTPEHKRALLQHGPTPHHRFSYKPVQAAMANNTSALALPIACTSV